MRLSLLTVIELTALLAFAALAALVIMDDSPAGQLVPLDAKALTTGPSRERWYGVFFQEQHVGWTMSRATPAAQGGTLYESRATFRIVTFGKLQEVITAGTALTDAEQQLRRFDFFMAAGQTRISARGEVHDAEILMEVDQAGERSTLHFPIDRPPQVGMTLEGVLATQQLSEGAELQVPYFDPLTMAEGTMQMRVTGTELLENGEEAWWLTSDFAGVQSRSLVTSAGETLRQEGGMGLSMVRMTEDKAREIASTDQPADLISLSAVQLRGELPDARHARRVSLRIRGVEPEHVMDQPPLQRVEGDVVTVDVPLIQELPHLPIRDDSDPQWLAATLTLPANHPELREQAADIVDGATDRLDATQRLVDWVYQHVEKVPVVGVPNGLEVLHTRQGDCNEHTALFVSLARAAGIPARIAAGVVYSDRIGDHGAFYYHAWPEVRLGGPTDWVPVDPTFGQVPADATHVKLAQGDLDRQVQIMTVMGRLGFEVVDAR